MKTAAENEHLDYINKQIIKRLAEDGKIPFSELAKELKISNSLVHQRVNKLIEADIIQGYSVKLNAKNLGYKTITYTGIVTKDAKYSYSIAEKLKTFPEVLECHWVSGKYTLFVKIVAKDNEDLRTIVYDRIHKIEGVGSTESFISFGEAFEKNISLK
ncbi:MAG TPA: Lrp/AsnC ligand binding domain-containing protein [Bacteroidia bacterium]|jgi:Lrp/AsnC family transcriptional regulator for asnA, asnC and gidA|nr:Lrp/AsnC ligand binding domain-containing protein [Bacteroidia bacterium]HRG53904.1 Lrp/AsnC ligand binding domain-containing protein [Bacteroidia bacterium]